MRTSHRRRTATAGVLLGGALLLGACSEGADLPGYGGDTTTESDTEPTSEESTSASPSATPAESAADEPDDPFEGGTAPTSVEPGDGAVLTVTDVRVGAHEDYDRVVFDLAGEGTPGWRAEYVDEALDAGSGNPVDVDGDAVLEVAITGTAMPMDSGVTEYGGDPVDGPGGAIDQVVYRFVFEGSTSAFVGVDGEPRPFRVFALEDPARVVIDVGH